MRKIEVEILDDDGGCLTDEEIVQALDGYELEFDVEVEREPYTVNYIAKVRFKLKP